MLWQLFIASIFWSLFNTPFCVDTGLSTTSKFGRSERCHEVTSSDLEHGRRLNSLHEVCPDLEALRNAHANRPLMFTPLRHDGAGMSILHMVFNAAYAYKRGWVYAGAVPSRLHTSEI